MTAQTLHLAYLASAVLFILSLKGLTSPSTARRGNVYAISGMVIALGATLTSPVIHTYGFILVGIVLGGVIGIGIAIRIQMTAMPQLVAMLHSFVGLAAVLVALGTYLNQPQDAPHSLLLIELSVGAAIGAITCTGSLIAFAKLQALISGNPLVFSGQHILNLGLGLLILLLVGYFVAYNSLVAFLLATGLALVLGVLLIVPIGGADMPVVISMLNSYSGWAAAATGFTLQNKLLIITGALVGFSGAILSYVMCKAMNRSIFSVVLGGFGGSSGATSATAAAASKGVKTVAPEDAAFWMNDAEKVIIVPGYGMAVAQAQHAVKEVMVLLEEKGVEVKYAIHPVAGRMPGHMNVLLAEADIPYDHVLEMDQINPEFPTTDVVLVVGANDVTNPAAKTDPSSSIYGMPILDVERARQIFVIKRSMRPGYAGVDNVLYYKDNCSLVFGDAKEVCELLAVALKN